MSLLSFVKLPAIRARFKREFIKPRLETSGIVMVAPPMTTNYQAVGTAFDYLLRFILQRHNPKSICGPWIAESAIMILKNSIRGYNLETGKLSAGSESQVRKAENILKRAKTLKSAFLLNGRVTNELLKISLQLACLDNVYRSSGYVAQIFSAIDNSDKRDIEDLKALIKAANADLTRFAVKNSCILNPSFGPASVLVGGADADIILDDMIIDIKTTKHLHIEPEYFYQLIGYYILSLIGKVEGLPSKCRITRVGIYFARHGYLYSLHVKELINPKTFPVFIEWFQKMTTVNKILLRNENYCESDSR